MTPFEQAWSLLKNERANLRAATVAARQRGRQVPEVGMSRLDGSPRIGGQQNRLMNYPGQMFQPRPSDTYRSRMPETGPVQSEAMDPEAVRAMGSRIQTPEQMDAQREGVEHEQGQPFPYPNMTIEDLVDMPTSHQLAEMRAEATQRALLKPRRLLNDYERNLLREHINSFAPYS